MTEQVFAPVSQIPTHLVIEPIDWWRKLLGDDGVEGMYTPRGSSWNKEAAATPGLLVGC
jgi:hypothetical protein